MTERTQVLSIRTLAPEGARFEENRLEERIENVRSDLIRDIPSLRTLAASTLHYEIQVLGNGVAVAFFLKEAGQLNLQFQSSKRAPIVSFQQDLERILDDQIRLRGRYERSLKAQGLESLDDDMAAIRARLQAERAKGEVTLHSSVEGEAFAFEPPPRVLPMSPVFWIEAWVTDLNAHVVRVKPTWKSRNKTELATLIRYRDWLDLKRSSPVQGLSAGITLTTALELKQILRLKVAAEVLWVDVATKSFSLLAFETHQK